MAMLDLVALATVADVAPLIGVNRAFVRQGLAVMARRVRPGIVALCAFCYGEANKVCRTVKNRRNFCRECDSIFMRYT